jgi:HTH-type transcriptional regulator / antitoxin HipB
MGHTLQVPSQLSSHLRALRKAKGLSQAALGARLGLSQARIARIEGEPLSISVEQLLRVLAALDVGVTLEPLQVPGPRDATVELAGLSAKGEAGTLTVKSAAKRARAKPDW